MPTSVKRSRMFSAERESIGDARRFATETLVGTAEEVLQSVELMVSELATNCIRHVRSGFRLTIHRRPAEIRVEVTDPGGGRPTIRDPGPEEPSGRGLMIVDMLAERWGVQNKAPAGKTVWFTLTDQVSTQSAQETCTQGQPRVLPRVRLGRSSRG